MTTPTPRQRAIEAAKVLNNLLGDLLAGTRSFEVFKTKTMQARLGTQTRGIMTRMSISYTLLALAKWLEFYRLYKRQIPPGLAPRSRELAKDLEGRGLRDFRNRVVGHIWDDVKNRPLTDAEVLSELSRIVGDDVPGFMLWVNLPANNTASSSVVGLVEATRDQILSEQGLTWPEVFNAT